MYAVRITPVGRSVLEKAQPIAQKVDAAVLQCLTEAERETFIGLLQRVVSQSEASQVEQAKVA